MTPAEIARRLTPAQRRALLWLPGDGSGRTLGRSAPPVLVREWLRAMGLMQLNHLNHRHLTSLGAAVRRIIEQEQTP